MSKVAHIFIFPHQALGKFRKRCAPISENAEDKSFNLVPMPSHLLGHFDRKASEGRLTEGKSCQNKAKGLNFSCFLVSAEQNQLGIPADEVSNNSSNHRKWLMG